MIFKATNKNLTGYFFKKKIPFRLFYEYKYGKNNTNNNRPRIMFTIIKGVNPTTQVGVKWYKKIFRRQN